MAAPQAGDPNPFTVPRRSTSKRSTASNSRSMPQESQLDRLPRRERRTRRSPQSASSPTLEETGVHSLRPKPKPIWLQLLLRTQQGSSIITILLGISALATYGWTVYLQQRWGNEYEKLETLKKQERQLVSANELLKNQMAEQAEKPTAGLLLPDPSNAIFLTPAPQRPEVKSKSIVPSAEPSPAKPLGY